MRKEISEYFSDKYKVVYKIFHRKQGRYMANLIGHDGKRTTMSWAKYVYCSFYKEDVPEGMQIDHINSNKLDDRIENLQRVSMTYNIKKDRKIKEMVMRQCPICKEEFLFEKRNLSTHPNPCCSRKCGGIKSHITYNQKVVGSSPT